MKIYKWTVNPIKQFQLCDQERGKKNASPFLKQTLQRKAKPKHTKTNKQENSCIRIISSIILIFKVWDKINPHFTSLSIGPSTEVSWGLFHLHFSVQTFFLHTMIYYVGNFRGYSLQLELLDWTPLADTTTPFFQPAAVSHNPIFIPNRCTFLHNVYFLLAKIKHALVNVFILKYRKIKTKHSSTEKSPNVSYFSSSCAHKKVTSCSTFWNKISNRRGTHRHIQTRFSFYYWNTSGNLPLLFMFEYCLDVFSFTIKISQATTAAYLSEDADGRLFYSPTYAHIISRIFFYLGIFLSIISSRM